jgi:Spy/CpxP family protein refolding chaperone
MKGSNAIMKMIANLRWLVLAALVVSCAGMAGDAQPQPKRPQGPAEKGPQFGPGAGRFGPGYQRLLSILTEEQKMSLREAMEQQREKVRDVEEKLRETTRELYAAGLTGKFDEESVRQKASSVAKWEAEMTVLRFKAFSQMRPQLSAEQIAKLREQQGSETGPIQGELPRKRREGPRDENGLPVKENPSPEKQ